MPNPKEFCMDYRPESYWNCSQEGFTNIKGEMRRRALDAALAGERPDLWHGSILSDELSDEERSCVTSVHPMLMGGEYLPTYPDGELEIARASLQSVTWDVISIRAQRPAGGRITYRVVDEYESDFKCRLTSSANPLTMGELISLIDGVEGHSVGFGEEKGLTDYYRNYNYDFDETLGHLNVLVDFVRVSSMYYPELEKWYEAEAQEWYRRKFAELKVSS